MTIRELNNKKEDLRKQYRDTLRNGGDPQTATVLYHRRLAAVAEDFKLANQAVAPVGR